MTDDDFARLEGLTSIDDFVAFILARDSKASSADMHAIWTDLGREPTPKAAFKRAREGAASRGEASAEPPEPGMLDQLEALIRDRVQVEGKNSDLKTLTAVYQFMKNTLTGDAKTEETEDWRRLTAAEADCLAALTSKLNGHELEPVDEWYVALLACVPAAPENVHPAHLPLPPGRPPTLDIPAIAAGTAKTVGLLRDALVAIQKPVPR